VKERANCGRLKAAAFYTLPVKFVDAFAILGFPAFFTHVFILPFKIRQIAVTGFVIRKQALKFK
jgi:hypothetical protein